MVIKVLLMMQKQAEQIIELPAGEKLIEGSIDLFPKPPL
jgi:hypothetical protein